uniref:ZZ-type domain-containing protein n=1 Tax=Leersia perrieri TaxID=77586 RepID=A0A0D9VHR9_9ORYZ
MSGRSSPMYEGFAPRSDGEWDVVLKVKYGETLKRFNGYVQGSRFSLNLSALRSKIAFAFKFGPDINFILTYTDEDGDIVMLDDDDDLHDAAIHQKLNPLRINVQLNSSLTTASQTKQQDSDNTPLRPTTIQDPLAQLKSVIDELLKPLSNPLRSTVHEDTQAQIKSAIDDAMKSIPEPIPDALAKLSHEVLGAAPPQLAELMKPFVQLVTPSNKNPSNGCGNGSCSFSSGLPQTQVDSKANVEPKIDTSLGPRPLGTQNSEPRGLKTLSVEAPATSNVKSSQHQQASLYPSIEDLLFSANLACSGDDKSAGKGIGDTQSKGKSVMMPATPPAPPAASVFRPAPPIPPRNDIWPQLPERGSTFYPSIWQSEADPKATSDSRWCLPSHRAGHPFRPHAPMTRASLQVPPAPTSLNYGPSPHFPYPGRLLSSGHLHGDLENSSARTFHRWIQCDGCGVQPIVGPRYKSKTKEDYDLCDACFHRMGNEVEYTRIDKPLLPQRLLRDPSLCRKIHPRSAMKSKREKLESRFILDVTVLDGTLMAPSTPFTKIWRMHNNGSIMWPLGTQLIWVGGDQFALQTSVPLEIPVNGFPVDQEIDVAVDFMAPARPGRYISYWRLASPSGQKFGQRVWVHIQVEDPSFVSNNRTAPINLNLPPETNSTNASNLIDVNFEPVDLVFDQHVNSTNKELLENLIHCEVDEPKNPEPALLSVPFVSSTASPHPVVDVPSTSTAAAFVPVVDVPAPELAMAPTVNEPAGNAPPSVGASASDHHGIDILTEEKLLKELEEMGFRQVDLNKEILRQNKYNLEQSVDDLCGVSEWDPLLAELQEMGFEDAEINKEMLARNGGSIKRAVMDLIAREKKDQ